MEVEICILQIWPKCKNYNILISRLHREQIIEQYILLDRIKRVFGLLVQEQVKAYFHVIY